MKKSFLKYIPASRVEIVRPNQVHIQDYKPDKDCKIDR
jgi:hypothetical protein